MTDADDERGDLLNTYLDAHAEGDSTEPDALDPATAEAGRRFFACDDVAALPPAVADLIWADIMDQTAHAGTIPPRSASPPPAGAPERLDRAFERRGAAHRNGHRPKEQTDMNQLEAHSLPHSGSPVWGWAPPARPRPVTRHRPFDGWRSLQAAGVVLLVLALAGGVLALRPGRPDSRRDTFGSAPVAQVSPDATPSAGVPLRTLVIPAAYLPAGEIRLSSWEFTAGSGTTQTFSNQTFAVNIDVVSTGSFGATSNDPRLIWRGGTDAPPEEIAAGAEGIVGPGDAIAYLGNATQTARVIGDDQVQALSIAFDDQGGDAGLGATGDATVALRRVTLAPGEALASAGETPILRLVEAGVLTWEVTRAGETTPLPSVTFSGNVAFTSLPGMTVVVRNDGDVPLVFLEATITLPAVAGTPAAGTPAG